MLTLGIDLAAQPQDTAACEVRWHQTHAEIVGWHNPLNDKQIFALIERADKVGIDVPLGWPTEFVRAIYRHHARKKKWPIFSMRRFRLRATDRFVAETTGIWPLSVSTDRIGIPAARAGGVFKKRLRKNQYRSIILARAGHYWVYEYLFAKQDRANIEDNELAEFRKLVRAYAGLSTHQVNQLTRENDWMEICNGNQA